MRFLPSIEMKKEIENRLSELKGLRLTDTSRNMNMECLKFGVKQKQFDNESLNIGQFGIHLQCDWRIINERQILIGSRDLHRSVTYLWNEEIRDYKGDLRDLLLNSLIGDFNLEVTLVKADEYGGFELRFKLGLKLQVFPMNSIGRYSEDDEFIEHWRLLDNRKDPTQHFVVRPTGIDK
ncbi:MAG: hypothetical protein AAF944_02680 [Bacteroidota bacterium]